MIRLTQTASLQQRMAPQLIQSLRLLQMPTLELEQLIQQELEINPLLEMADEQEEDENSDEEESDAATDDDSSDDSDEESAEEQEFEWSLDDDSVEATAGDFAFALYGVDEVVCGGPSAEYHVEWSEWCEYDECED